ncbi:DNA repair protein rad18 [Ophiobolus disseminans]|uniref:Postreplication repair E3 ubiquitin-protein ligase RAD18 n=1 Tax=Ophiobolus disseminans TaxID=1469910 RepID=A0A6A7A847_9PLEO|nr:DNA repair protein rad18 [Ophiobolus disseminans]
MDTTFDLPDSTDWLSTTLPAFEPLEAALRCEVCKEFLSNPVITSCSHTFCSICIRRCIATDGRCPSCKSACSSDKLTPNIAVREVVMRFQEARPKALEMARAEKEAQSRSGKKRKLDETDIEDGEPVRQTRSRQTRSKGRHSQSTDPIEVADSEDGDDEFLPEGMAKCPICNTTMKEEQVFNHLDVCPEQNASQGRSTRSSRTKNTFPNPLQRRQKDPSPPPTRLSQLNYALLKEGPLRKKLQEIGIPNWGNKDLLKRRHIEWLNIYNSNCDADEGVRKTKRQLVKELEEWENTQGGKAETKENKMMKKDFDGSGYAKSHKTEFDDLISKARAKRATPKPEETKPSQPEVDATQPPKVNESRDPEPTPHNGSDPYPSQPTQIPIADNPRNPYENNESALATIRAKVAAANQTGSTLATLPSEPSLSENDQVSSHDIGIANPLGSPARKVPMFALPGQPVRDLDSSGSTH